MQEESGVETKSEESGISTESEVSQNSTSDEAEDLNPWDSNEIESDSTQPSYDDDFLVDNTEEYGGRGEPEKLVNFRFLPGDTIEFAFEGGLYVGVAEEVSAGTITIKHLDEKHFGKVQEYDLKNLTTLPNFIILRGELRSENITAFQEFHEQQLISFYSTDLDNENNPVRRLGIIRAIDHDHKKLKLYRKSGPPKPAESEDEDFKQEVVEVFKNLASDEEAWDQSEITNIQEIITPPSVTIEQGSIKQTKERKTIDEIPFTGPKPGFKPGKDLGPGAADFDWLKQIITREHVETFQLENSNKEGERLRLLAENRYASTRKDSKWRRYRPLTVEIFYAFQAAKLGVKVFGWNLEAFFTKNSFSNQTGPGQVLYG